MESFDELRSGPFSTDECCKRGDEFALARGPLAAKRVQVHFSEHFRFFDERDGAIFGTTRCSGGDAEGLIARCPIGGGCKNLHHAAVIIMPKQHVAQAATGERMLSSGKQRG